MGATKNINIRVAPDRKLALQALADAFGESVTEFVMKSVFLRASSEKPKVVEEGPLCGGHAQGHRRSAHC